MPNKSEIETLPEELRVAWIRTILALNGTERQCQAFMDGYNGSPAPSHASERMLANHELGVAVHRYTQDQS